MGMGDDEQRMGARAGNWRLVIGGLIVALVLPELRLAQQLFPQWNIAALLGREFIWWCIAVALVAYVLFVEKRALASIGWKRPTWKTFVFGFAAGVVSILLFPICFGLIFQRCTCVRTPAR
jgi:hypothetical protein